jgi:isopentenyl diphosphate isomerase/L-lactate dehydrogenase-like FMN-dependent dehydrogenase
MTVFDYIDGGAGSESTVRANRHALESLPIIPRLGVTRGSPPPALETSVLGKPISFPVMLSPVGFARMMHPAGDVAAAAAADDAGTVHTLSTFSGHTLEEVAGAATARRWFQLYFLGGRGGAEALIARAAAVGYEALVVTLDTQAGAMRERDVRHGVRLPLRITLDNVLRFAPEAVAHPGWLLGFAQDRFHMDLANAAASAGAGGMALDEALRHLRASPPLWEDFRWIRDQWPGPILAKGILSADDARRAVDAGVAGVIVSNHGGRQLDGAPPTIGVLPDVVAAAGSDAEIFVDGGFRRGADVVRALSLGARAVMVGRPWAFGLAAAGEAGVAKVLDLLRADVERVLRLIGCPSVGELGPGYLGRPDASLLHRQLPVS